jgi:hypothetical protein
MKGQVGEVQDKKKPEPKVVVKPTKGSIAPNGMRFS